MSFRGKNSTNYPEKTGSYFTCYGGKRIVICSPQRR
nr:MAG TPA: hypothetical protein [Caudoviricetes sp.]